MSTKNKKVVASYDYYTLEQAREIIYEEIRHKNAMKIFRENQEKKKNRKRKRVFLKQRLLGLFVFIVSIIEIVLKYFGVIDECAAFIVMLPLGLGLIFTRKKVIYSD